MLWRTKHNETKERSKITIELGDFHYLVIVICDIRGSEFKLLLTVVKFFLLAKNAIVRTPLIGTNTFPLTADSTNELPTRLS